MILLRVSLFLATIPLIDLRVERMADAEETFGGEDDDDIEWGCDEE